MGAIDGLQQILIELQAELSEITGGTVLVRYNLETELIEITYVTAQVARTETIKECNIDKYIEYVKNPGSNIYKIGN